jgi:hypothetical protein
VPTGTIRSNTTSPYGFNRHCCRQDQMMNQWFKGILRRFDANNWGHRFISILPQLFRSGAPRSLELERFGDISGIARQMRQITGAVPWRRRQGIRHRVGSYRDLHAGADGCAARMGVLGRWALWSAAVAGRGRVSGGDGEWRPPRGGADPQQLGEVWPGAYRCSPCRLRSWWRGLSGGGVAGSGGD